MPLYSYKVRDEVGKIFTGETKVASQDALINLLQEKGYTPLEIKEKNVFTDISQIKLFKKRVTVKDLALFCRQFAIVMEAGIPIGTAMDVLREQTQNKTLKECLNDIYGNIQKGISLSQSMKQFQGSIFPEILVHMVESGEVSGQLESVFHRMAETFEKDFKLQQKIKSAMMYPVIVCVIAIGVIAILMTYVLPSFKDVLLGLGTELPIYTKILMAVSDTMKTYWYLFLGGLVGLIVGGKVFSGSEFGKEFISKMALTLPIIGKVSRGLNTASFARTLSTLISSGVLLIESLEIVTRVINNVVLKKKLLVLIDEVKRGKGLFQPLNSMKIFPPLLNSMIRIGEESGELDFTLGKCADFYDEEVDTLIQQAVSFIEPAIIVILAVVVGFIMLAVMGPMFSIYDQLA